MAVRPDTAVSVRRGQFFVIGALLLVALLAGLVLFDVGGLFAPQTEEPKQLFDRSLDEFPRMINTVTAEDASADLMERRLASYMAFQEETFAAHGLQSTAHALVGVPHPVQDDVAFVLTNTRGDALEDVTVTVDGETQRSDQVEDGGTAQFAFNDLPSVFDVQLTFTGEHTFNETYTAHRDQYTALYHLRIDGEQQRWQTTRTY